ncbi:low-affinity methionine permease [Kluyveromyces marxianus]|uniref:Low-affinity methionine permease n=2 Tax=Kluyveromyces marxianus TaxID=4911 RepID=W0TGF6_KLUMD|nr:low-affinity methionine permease [Kluyveromyces marxianus DMKU3-1042]QGN17987.1 low-affinity methionine permease [Kluyveromyces marxianus]BAO42727.1 low-affinity methionine permease [Kluyveromyces marxianus DMKU3-1042]BAP74097.1 low-affinity methionine permease [Kluyveromyces marxianus]
MEETNLGEGTKKTHYVTEIASESLEDLEENVTSVVLNNEVPQGRHLGLFSTVNLFVSRIIGGGIYAVPSSVFINCGGNIPLFLSVWIIAAIIAFIGMSIFLELGAALPRSGGRKNFLEVMFNRPWMMTTVMLCSFSILTCFAISPAIILGKYILYALGYDAHFVNEESYASNYIAIISVIVIVLMHGLSLNHGILIQNFLGIIKFVIILIMCGTGTYVILFYENGNIGTGVSSVNTLNYFGFESTVSTASIATAFIQCFYCFAGWDTVHNVTSEIKNPTRTLKLAGPLSLLIALICYLLLNIAYVKVLSYDEIQTAGPLIGSVLFTKLLGESIGGKFIIISIILSAGSNLFVTIYGVSRMNQEVFREGLFPFSTALARNWPFTAPLPSLVVCGFVSCFWLSIIPNTGPAFDYVVSFEGYGNQIILLFVAIGLLFRKKCLQSHDSTVVAPKIGIVIFVIFSFYLSIAPFIGKQAENSLTSLPPYPISALLLFLLSFLYWLFTFKVFPFVFGYTLKKKVVIQEDGLEVFQWSKKKYI